MILTIVLMQSESGKRLRGQGGMVPPSSCYECAGNGCQFREPCNGFPDEDILFTSTVTCNQKCKVYCGPNNLCLWGTAGQGSPYNSMEECKTSPLCPQGGGSSSAGWCGDGICNAGEDCNSCPNDCQCAPPPKCGDGQKNKGDEECDDGNQSNTDACTNACKNAKCGDGLVWKGQEDCDDGNQNDTDKCSNTCHSRPNCTQKSDCIGRITDLKECIDITPEPPICLGRACLCNLGFCVAVEIIPSASECPIDGIGGIGVIGGISGTNGGSSQGSTSGTNGGSGNGGTNGSTGGNSSTGNRSSFRNAPPNTGSTSSRQSSSSSKKNE